MILLDVLRATTFKPTRLSSPQPPSPLPFPLTPIHQQLKKNEITKTTNTTTTTIAPTTPNLISPTNYNCQQFPLQILKQTASSNEKFSFNGLQKIVYIVVKNAPFFLQIGIVEPIFCNQLIDLNKFGFEAVLMYDSEDSESKDVDYVKAKPVEFKCTVSEGGDQLAVELRIKVLSSQHENSFFRVKVLALDPTTGIPISPFLMVISEPIKVISKPEQLKKKSSPKKNVSSAAAPAQISISSTSSTSDLLMETLSSIQSQQIQHQKLLEKLLLSTTIPITMNQDASDTIFYQRFKIFFQMLNSLAPEQRSLQVRKLLRNSSQKDLGRIVIFLSELFKENLVIQSYPAKFSIEGCSAGNCGGGCQCFSCPFKKELEKIDEFYRSFVDSPQHHP